MASERQSRALPIVLWSKWFNWFKVAKIPASPINYLYPYVKYCWVVVRRHIYIFSKGKKQQSAILARGFPEGWASREWRHAPPQQQQASERQRNTSRRKKTLWTVLRDAENSLPREHLNTYLVNKTIFDIRDLSSDVRERKLSRMESLGRPLTSHARHLFYLTRNWSFLLD